MSEFQRTSFGVDARAFEDESRRLPLHSGRLGRIDDWTTLARQSSYQPGQLAVLCAISLRQLERFCKGAFQLTPNQWLRRVRLREAERMLARGCTVKVVAYELGFKQLSHFSREFKRHTGWAPNAFTRAAISPPDVISG